MQQRSPVVRWLPTVSMTLVSLISYIDRNTLALLAPTILKETGLNAQQYSWIISAFSVAYMAGNPAWGWLLDRYGVQRGMTASVVLWTAASAAHALVSGVVGFASARALLGFGEGATFPGGLRTAIRSLPETSRSRGIAVAYSGGSLGAIVTPLIVTPVALAFGWRGAFWFTGLIGLAWLLLWQFVGRLVPEQTPAAPKAASTVRFTDPRLWAFMASYALGGLPLAFVIYFAPLYLTQIRGLDQAALGKVLWIPPLGWEMGYFFWGWLADRARARNQSYFRLLAASAIASVALAFAPVLPGAAAVLAALLFSMFIAASFVIVSIAYATDAFSAANSGLIAGLGAGSWSLFVAIIMPAFGYLAETRQYSAAFTLAAAVPVAGFGLWFLLERRYD